MNKTTMTFEDFTALRAEFPEVSPATLYDVACLRMALPFCWATAGWFACSVWMDNFANAPTSYVMH